MRGNWDNRHQVVGMSYEVFILFRYHITCGTEKKVTGNDDKKLLKAIIQNEFSAEAFSLQSWDNEFTDWVTVSNVAELPDCRQRLLASRTTK